MWDIFGQKEKAWTKLLIMSFLNVQTMGLNGLKAPCPQFLAFLFCLTGQSAAAAPVVYQ